MRLTGSSSNGSIDTNSNSNSNIRTDGSDDHNTKGLIKEERGYLNYNTDNDSSNDSYGDSISNSDSEGSHSSNSYESSFDSKQWTQLVQLVPTEDQIFIMTHIELAYREKQAHAIYVEKYGYANGGEGLDGHIAALCRKLSKDQIVFLEEQYEQFYREATEAELDGEALNSHIAQYGQYGCHGNYSTDSNEDSETNCDSDDCSRDSKDPTKEVRAYIERRRSILADCGLCSSGSSSDGTYKYSSYGDLCGGGGSESNKNIGINIGRGSLDYASDDSIGRDDTVHSDGSIRWSQERLSHKKNHSNHNNTSSQHSHGSHNNSGHKSSGNH